MLIAKNINRPEKRMAAGEHSVIAGVVSNSHHGVQVSGLKRAVVKMPAVVGTRGFLGEWHSHASYAVP